MARSELRRVWHFSQGRAVKTAGWSGYNWGPGVTQTWLHHSLSTDPLASWLASLSLSLFICKMGHVITLIGRIIKIK